MLYLYKATIERVVDGDTVDLMIDQGLDGFQRETCRLWGVDAPEMRTKAGKEAKAYLMTRIIVQHGTQSPQIYVRTVKRSETDHRDKTDKYGRYLAILYDEPGDVAEDIETLIHAKSLDRRSVNWQIIEAGHGTERYW